MELRERVVVRFKLAGAVANPKDLAATLLSNLREFEQFEPEAKKLLEVVNELKKVRAVDPHGVAQKPLWDKALADGPLLDAILRAVSFTFYAKFRDTWELSLAILQQFSLPPAQRRKIEQISKYWATKQKPKRVSLRYNTMEERFGGILELYIKQLETLRDQAAAIQDALAKSKPMSEAQELKRTAGPFTLVNTGGFKDDVIDDVATVVEKAAKLMIGKGFSRICYGDINISKKVGRGNVLAFYLQESDEFFIRAGVRLNVDTLHTVLHEFGHRLHRKFLMSKDRAINSLYATYVTKKRFRIDEGEIDESKLPKVGEEYPYKGEILVVKKLDWFKRKVELVPKEPPDSRRTLSTTFSDFNIVFRGEEASKVSPTGFVTQYASKAAAENFAEMFGYYCTDELSAGQVADFEALLG